MAIKLQGETLNRQGGDTVSEPYIRVNRRQTVFDDENKRYVIAIDVYLSKAKRDEEKSDGSINNKLHIPGISGRRKLHILPEFVLTAEDGTVTDNVKTELESKNYYDALYSLLKTFIEATTGIVKTNMVDV